MAWCVRLRRGNDVELLCGVSVEVRDDGFFEGAWAGNAEDFDFDSAADVFGSGGRIIGDDLIIVTPSHTLERYSSSSARLKHWSQIRWSSS